MPRSSTKKPQAESSSRKKMLPLTELLEVCSKAPYGRREATILDDSVRKTYQLQPTQLEFKNAEFMKKLNKKFLPTMAKRLRLDQYDASHLELEFYKLLVYTPGCMFKPHRDSEKTERMLATLVVILPSIYTGGEMVLYHNDRSVTVDHSGSSEPHFCAFFLIFSTKFCL